MLAKNENAGLEKLPTTALAEMANEAARNVETHARSAVKNAITAGRALVAAKAQVAHGQWLDWLAANWEYSQALAYRYIEIANFYHGRSLDQNASIREALRMIAESKPDKEPVAEPTQLFDEPDEEPDVVAEDNLFTCATCEEQFSRPVWHCDECGHHWDETVEQCRNCYKTEIPEHWADAENSDDKPERRPPGQPPAKKIEKEQKPYFTADEWSELHCDLQLTIRSEPELFGRDNATFNKQDSASIEWAQWSWNPVTGCKHDCPYCYARDIANRFYPQKFEPSIYPERFLAPRNTKVPDIAKQNVAYKNVFTCSMADLFGRWVPLEWIEWVMKTVADNPQWNFLFLTKFPQRFAELGELPPNAWMGTTVDCQSRVKNAEKAFAKVKGGTKWLSVEPMLTPLKFSRLDLFNWVVIGGASASAKTPAWVPPFDVRRLAFPNALNVGQQFAASCPVG